jgi:putative transposase
MIYRHGYHSPYGLKYHIVFCTKYKYKYRYRVLTGDVAVRVIELIREICLANYVDIESGNISPDHVHMLISVPPNQSLSKIVQYIKGKSSRKPGSFNSL